MNFKKVFDNGRAVCEEFSRHTYADTENYSLLINVDVDWAEELIKRMIRNKFKIVTKIEMSNTITFVFQLEKKMSPA